MIRTLPFVYSQRDYLQRLGIGVATIADVGCYLTSFSECLLYFGKYVNPVELNNIFIQKLLYINTNEMVDDNLMHAFPDVLYQESLHYESVPADLDKLRTLLADPTLFVIIEVDLGAGHTHFASCIGINGVVTIANPWTGHVEDFSKSYGDPVKNILKFIVYKGTPVVTDGTIDQQGVIDQLRADRDKNWNSYQEEQKKNADLTTESTNLQHNIAEVQKRNSDLATEISQMEKADSTAIDKGVQLQGLVTDFQDYLHAIADSVKVQFDLSKIKDTVESILGAIAALKKPQNQSPLPTEASIPLDTTVQLSNNKNAVMVILNAIKKFIFNPK